MLNALLGRKIGMTQVFGPNGTVIPVTVIEAGPCVVTQVKTVDHDGYNAVQIGFEQRPVNRAIRPQLGHLGHSLPLLKAQRKRLQTHQQELKASGSHTTSNDGEAKTSSDSAEEKDAEISVDNAFGSHTTSKEMHSGSHTTFKDGGPDAFKGDPNALQGDAQRNESKPDKQIEKLLRIQQNRQRRPGPVLGPFRVIREVELQQGITPDKVELGSLFDVGLFINGEAVDIVGTSKGKGFQGVMKRHGFGGGPRTHGQSDRSRAPGSIGSGTTPGRVLKGTRMAGRMGNARITAKKLQVIQADPERNLLVVKGSVPGANGGLLMIRKLR
jgi:large subunit ribosomal protein L3